MGAIGLPYQPQFLLFTHGTAGWLGSEAFFEHINLAKTLSCYTKPFQGYCMRENVSVITLVNVSQRVPSQIAGN